MAIGGTFNHVSVCSAARQRLLLFGIFATALLAWILALQPRHEFCTAAYRSICLAGNHHFYLNASNFVDWLAVLF